ncbi:hypothetical protein TrCOL_g4394 [Triparma columacea]|uniref:DUF547 domain-containing protein n=1 Tax=Triparma columacea TaxID=722753 RepID=A0A9W7G5V3_9STRA|nr:hypothetical protein TrCOL_g4394 [Triparma columacea]
MIKLTSRFTVPQVFVNDHYIGGADDFKKFTGIFPENRKEEPKGDMSWFEEPAKVEETKLRPVQESERVVELPTPPFLDKTDYVSLIKADRGSANDAKTPSVLNCLVSYKDRVDPNPIAVVHRLKKQLDKIIEKHRDDKQAVDYQAIKELDEFLEFEVATAELQSVKLADMDDGVKKAFCINLYNLMIKHAFTKVGVPTDKSNRGPFFTGVGYQLGEGYFTFDHLENGVLRSNRNGILKHEGDKRFAAIFPDSSVDCRIHFALNCGAASCPPIKKFTSIAIDDELDVVARAYCEDEGNVKVEDGKVWVNQIFNWYGKDFGGNDEEKLRTIVQWCEGEKKIEVMKVIDEGGGIDYMVYDWGSDAREPVRSFEVGDAFKEMEWGE